MSIENPILYITKLSTTFYTINVKHCIFSSQILMNIQYKFKYSAMININVEFYFFYLSCLDA